MAKALFTLLVVLLAGCAVPPANAPAMSNTDAAYALPAGAPSPRASKCGSYISAFGTVHGIPVPGHGYMGLTDDGWCGLNVRFNIHDQTYLPPIAVDIPPSHGQLTILNNGVRFFFFYRPVAGFSGSDSFQITATFPDHTRKVLVTITVGDNAVTS